MWISGGVCGAGDAWSILLVMPLAHGASSADLHLARHALGPSPKAQRGQCFLGVVHCRGAAADEHGAGGAALQSVGVRVRDGCVKGASEI